MAGGYFITRRHHTSKQGSGWAGVGRRPLPRSALARATEGTVDTTGSGLLASRHQAAACGDALTRRDPPPFGRANTGPQNLLFGEIRSVVAQQRGPGTPLRAHLGASILACPVPRHAPKKTFFQTEDRWFRAQGGDALGAHRSQSSLERERGPGAPCARGQKTTSCPVSHGTSSRPRLTGLHSR